MKRREFAYLERFFQRKFKMPIEESDHENDPKRCECENQTQQENNQDLLNSNYVQSHQHPNRLSILNVSAISYTSNGSSMASTSAGFSQYRDVDTESIFSKNSLGSKNKDIGNDYDDEDDENDHNNNINNNNNNDNNNDNENPTLDDENFHIEDSNHRVEEGEDNSNDSTSMNRGDNIETIEPSQAINTNDSQFNNSNSNNTPILDQSQQANTSNHSTLTNQNENDADQSVLYNSNYSRLTHTVRSYLNATNSISTENLATTPANTRTDTNTTIRINPPNTLSQLENNYNNFSFSSSSSSVESGNNSISSSQLNLDKLLPFSSFKIDYFNPTLGGPLKFEPKSSLFNELLRKVNENLDKVSATRAKTNITDVQILLKLANLYLAYENYYTAMFVPMNDNFKLNDNNIINISSDSNKSKSDNSSNNNKNTNASDASTYLEKFSSSDFSFKRVKRAINEDNSYNYDNDLSFLIDSSNEIESYLNEILNNSVFSINQNRKTKSNEEANQNENSDDKGCITNEFYLCSLCCHCLIEPITLVCGCSFCKCCFKEYTNKLMKYKYKKLSQNTYKLFDYSNLIDGDKLRPHKDDESDSSDNDLENSSKSSSTISLKNSINKSFKRKFGYQAKISPNRCYNCNKEHDHNTTNYIKPNVLLCKLIDKYWSNNVEIRKLRNDIRNYICFSMESNHELFDVDKFKCMFEEAYKLDPSNHLILADLFLLSYFNGCNPECLKYADMAAELRPNWPLAFYMKCVYYKNIGDFTKLKQNLIECLRLDPTLERIRIKLYLLLRNQNNSMALTPTRKCEFNFESVSSLKNQIDDINLKNQKAIKLQQSLITEKNADIDLENKINVSLLDKISAKTNELIKDDDANQQQRSILNFDVSKYIVIISQLVKPIELECSLCYRLLYKPVTTPCGHTFCCSCLDRSLDHQDKCPLCKNSLADYLGERRQNTTKFLDKLLKSYYSVEYSERKKQQREELKEIISSENEIPVFVCTLALPFAPCPLHIYEPRYRLMLRRAIESGSKQFGMCMYTEKTPYRFTEYGCMLEIRSHQFTRDGRAIVATIGGRRFKVLNSSTKDGYTVAQVEWVKDIRVEDEQERTELQVLHDEVRRLALAWYSYIPQVQKNRIFDIYGMSELPEPEEDIQANDNGPVWHWFLLNILPLENDFQYRFLTKTSLKERLKQIKKIILLLMAPFERIRQMRNAQSTNSASSSNLTSSQDNQSTNINNNNNNANENTNSEEVTQNSNLDTSSANSNNSILGTNNNNDSNNSNNNNISNNSNDNANSTL